MPEVALRIEEIDLDHDNPRISHAEGQQDALQKIVRDQKGKLLKLAESVVERGLNPMDRLLVLRLNRKPERFVSLEGNRRIAAFRLLANPSVMTGLEMPSGMRASFERLSKKFKASRFEPLACFEVASREDARYWLNLRHNIGHDGAGVDNWKSLAKRRFMGKSPVLQALELVTERAGLTPSEAATITEKFPTSTLERLLENRAVRKELGLDIENNNLITKLPADEVAKPLKKIVLDLATKTTRVSRLMKTEDMLDYLRTDLGKDYLPDLSKVRSKARRLEAIPTTEFAKVQSGKGRRKPDPSDRKEIVPKNCKLNVVQNRAAEIYKELRTIRLNDAPNAIAVLLRVFLELSVDYFITKHGGSLRFLPAPGAREQWKSLDSKVAEVVAIMIKVGVPKSDFAAITSAVSNKNSPMHTELLHRYVHDPFQTPVPRELAAAWDHAQPLFEKIWP